MPDGPRYDDDFYAWTQHQAEVLRTVELADSGLDIEERGRGDRVRGQA